MPTIYELTSWVLLAEAGGDGEAEKTVEEAANDGGGGLFGGNCSFFLPFLLIGILFYFMMIRPQKREQSRMKDMISNLKKSDRVVTAGGIFGTVVNVQKESPYVTIKVDEASNAKLKIMRTSISRVVTDDESEETKDKNKDAV